jgi:lipid A 3-O-deacylase
MMRSFLILAWAITPACVMAQAIDKTYTYENINSDRYIRFNYENDFFAASDRYFTQGLNMELALPVFKKIPTSKLLLTLPGAEVKYGIGVEHDAYTPTSIQSNSILYGDRPFAGALFLNLFSITQTDKQQQSSTLSLGVLGAAAGAQQMQTSIHAWTNNIDPQGWQFQIQNDFIINYRLTYERLLLATGNNFFLNANASARLGTLSTKAGVGLTLMAGLLEHPFLPLRNRNFSIYVYERPLVNVVGYDATMQGGLLNRDSPYTIDAGDIDRLVFENRLGFTIRYKKISLEYFRTYITREFRTGFPHAWGGVGMGVLL